jgi:hypothetical protein
MQALPQTDTAQAADDEVILRAVLAGTARELWQLPESTETAFRQARRTRASELLRQAVLALFTLHLLVLIPLLVHGADDSVKPWLLYTTLPVIIALLGLWLLSRLPRLEDVVETVICGAAGFALAAMFYGAMRLNGQYFGELAQYEAMYVMLIILVVLPPRLAVPTSLVAAGLGLVATALGGYPIDWLELQMYFSVPLVLCTVIGLILEYSERRNFVQNVLIQRESRRLAQLNAAAEENVRQQRYVAEYLALTSGNLSLKELFSRTLRFLVENTGGQVGAAYHLSSRGTLRRVAGWALDAERLNEKKELPPEATLMGPALASGELMQLRRVRADYLPIDLGMGSLPCAALLVIPIVQAGKPLAVIELGRLDAFSEADCARADAIRSHLAYAVAAANAREIGLRATA